MKAKLTFTRGATNDRGNSSNDSRSMGDNNNNLRGQGAGDDATNGATGRSDADSAQMQSTTAKELEDKAFQLSGSFLFSTSIGDSEVAVIRLGMSDLFAAARRRTGWSIKKTAYALGVTPRDVRRYEARKMAAIRMRRFATTANVRRFVAYGLRGVFVARGGKRLEPTQCDLASFISSTCDPEKLHAMS